MRHRVRGRKLGRNASHRKAMFRNMAVSLIRSVAVDEDEPNPPKVPGRVVTTLPKAKELRPFVEKLVTLGRRGAAIQKEASQFASAAERNSAEWKKWRDSDQWRQWNQAMAPAIACRRKAFALLRDKQAVQILFDDLAERFAERPGGYTRVVRLAQVRLGDAGQQAFIEFVGERDRVKSKKRQRPTVEDDASSSKPEDEPKAEQSDEKPADEEKPAEEAAAEEKADEKAEE